MEVIWFKRAIQDLVLAKEYIAKDNTNATISTVQRIRDKVNLLCEQQSIGRLGRIPNTRELVIDKTPYILPYRVRDNKVEILRVLHSSRRWPTSI
jgi:toxin ParE1/3/4